MAAVTKREGGRAVPWPLLTAVARFAQNAAPVPPILSNTSGTPPDK